MALLDKLDDLRGKATEMMQSGVAIAKLKTDNMADEDAMRRAYLAIGKMYFELYGDAPDAAFATECDRIRACQLRIAENNLRLAQMKDDIMDSSTDSSDKPQNTSAKQPQSDEVPFEAEEIPIVEKAPQEPDTVPEEKEEIPLDETK
ncbi:MAG: hypothetical protein KHY76_07640 [Butyricicoccus pullicaecorum]|nr:hypothetical protein [Butyricicoccus pullicaecorum]